VDEKAGHPSFFFTFQCQKLASSGKESTGAYPEQSRYCILESEHMKNESVFHHCIYGFWGELFGFHELQSTKINYNHHDVDRFEGETIQQYLDIVHIGKFVVLSYRIIKRINDQTVTQNHSSPGSKSLPLSSLMINQSTSETQV